jgi:tRNA(Ile)-lysidine synthase
MALAVYAGLQVTSYHVDHGIREGSADEAAIVAQAAERLGADFVALTVVCPTGPNLEARARRARFDALPDDVATGHTADDQAETIIVNLLRGSTSAGLAGMRLGPRHPILRLRRADTHRLVSSLGLIVVNDPSNASSIFVRNRIRHEALPLLADISRRDLAPLIARQAEILGEESDLLDELAQVIDPTDVMAVRNAPPPLARRAIRTWLRALDANSYPPNSAAIERVLAVARGEVVGCQIAGGLQIRRSAGRLHVFATPVLPYGLGPGDE